MKKNISILFSALALSLAFTSCGGEDEPSWKNNDVKVSYRVLNHVYDSSADKVFDLSTSTCNVVFHRANNTADVTLVPGDALPGASFTLTGLECVLDGEGGRYVYKSVSTPDSRITNMTLTIDFNEQALEAHYTLDGSKRVVSRMTKVFFLSNSSVLTYGDASESSSASAIYEYEIDPASMTATMTLAEMTNTQLVMLFKTVVARGLAVKVTPQGYELEAERPVTVSQFGRYDSTTGSDFSVDATDDKGYQKYPIANFKSTITLDAGAHTTSFQMGRADESTLFTVRASGTTYADK